MSAKTDKTKVYNSSLFISILEIYSAPTSPVVNETKKKKTSDGPHL